MRLMQYRSTSGILLEDIQAALHYAAEVVRDAQLLPFVSQRMLPQISFQQAQAYLSSIIKEIRMRRR